MRLTTKGRFAVTAMIDLGLRYGGQPVALAEISALGGMIHKHCAVCGGAAAQIAMAATLLLAAVLCVAAAALRRAAR